MKKLLAVVVTFAALMTWSCGTTQPLEMAAAAPEAAAADDGAVAEEVEAAPEAQAVEAEPAPAAE